MNSQVLRCDEACRLCGSIRISTLYQLRDTPLEDQFVDAERAREDQPVYPLELAICDGCGYVHLPYIVNPEISYADYVYVSEITVGLRGHYDEYAKKIAADYELPQDSLAVDLGSNDGSMLASFKKLGMGVVGVEPARAIAQRANENGLPTINGFFTDDVASQIIEEHGLAHVITANYMYANIDDVVIFTKAVSRLLAPDGVFVVQTGYHPEQMKLRMFDYIYHEHFSYFTAEVLKNVFSICGIDLIQVEKTSPKGGSIRAVGQLRDGQRVRSANIDALVAEERSSGMREVETYRSFFSEVNAAKSEVVDCLQKLKAGGKKIVGFGASHSTTTLLYHFEIAKYLEYLVDDNKVKQGLFSPGYHLPVYSTDKLCEDAPDAVIILAWQHRENIIKRHSSYLDRGGIFVVPLPSLKVIDGSD